MKWENGTQPPWDAPTVRDPAWARAGDARGMLCGVLYTGVELVVADRLLLEGARAGGRMVATFAAMGPKLFFGRADGPWVPWDDRLEDPALGCAVRDRPWPWCLGDEVWIAAVLEGELQVLLRFLDDGEVHVFALSFRAGLDDAGIAALARRWGEREAGALLRRVHPA